MTASAKAVVVRARRGCSGPLLAHPRGGRDRLGWYGLGSEDRAVWPSTHPAGQRGCALVGVDRRQGTSRNVCGTSQHLVTFTELYHVGKPRGRVGSHRITWGRAEGWLWSRCPFCCKCKRRKAQEHTCSMGGTSHRHRPRLPSHTESPGCFAVSCRWSPTRAPSFLPGVCHSRFSV